MIFIIVLATGEKGDSKERFIHSQSYDDPSTDCQFISILFLSKFTCQQQDAKQISFTVTDVTVRLKATSN